MRLAASEYVAERHGSGRHHGALETIVAFAHTKLRNRVIRVFHALCPIERWGSGIQRMTAACRAACLTAPVFEEIATRFRVTLATTRVGPTVVQDTDRVILEALGGSKGLATSKIAAAMGLSPRATRARLARLVDRRLVREIVTGPRDPRRRYVLA
jgi:predicted HTH transcriptional regulator